MKVHSLNAATPQFKATPQQIKNGIRNAEICPGKKAFLYNIATYFEKLENKMQNLDKFPDTFEYYLTKENNIPKNLAKTRVRTGFLEWTSLKSIDKELQEKSFNCGGESHCTCGRGKNLAEFAAELLKKLGFIEPNKITISKK